MKCVPFDDVCSCCLPNKKKQCLCESVRLMLYVGQKLTGTVSVSAKQSPSGSSMFRLRSLIGPPRNKLIRLITLINAKVTCTVEGPQGQTDEMVTPPTCQC